MKYKELTFCVSFIKKNNNKIKQSTLLDMEIMAR